MTSTQPRHSFFYRNGLSLLFITLFILTMGAQAVTGWAEHNEELQLLNAGPLTFTDYLRSGHFISATFENFESEFLQMSVYVLLTINLRQQGSAESKSLDEPEEVDREPTPGKDAPWPVNKGGWVLKLYENSLSLVFLLLFLVSWSLHLRGSWLDHNQENRLNSLPEDSIAQYLLKPTFWFETFQNWQSEFLSIACIVVFTIFLRQKGSPESKPVDAPDTETGK
ncbi:DUF6766 family protein [Dyadobacter sandarakinus]|uniref:Transmembrane protein n=1 Tax=Dyadobacter sandarakinus TaxID=2747268 RepID=A0ABX7I3S8_9BACT|nr:DUF6766 family protein [Dyadobacter sandarakinus]QRR00575.1 hypothetical protein HWI92_06470 [Dyadobacter sandarakinus]